MEKEIEEFNDTLLKLYFKNLDYLKEEHPNVFEKINILSDNINNGLKKEQYSLEYKEEGYFDILNIETNEFIYNYNSYDEADKRTELINFTNKHSLDLLRVNPHTNNFALMQSLGTAIPLVDYLNRNIDFSNITFHKIFKFIFLGVGVGVHIHEIFKKIDSMCTLIIEPNIEIFRLSLFTTDYSIFNKNNKKLFLSIDENAQERVYTLTEFSNYQEFMNYNIKHHLFCPEYKYLLDEIIDYYSHNFSASFSYNTILKIFSRTVQFMKKEYKFLKNSLVEEYKPLKNKKVLIIGAAPSINKQMDWIEKNQSKFIVMCTDKMIQKLEKHSITPDIVISIDPLEIVESFFKTKNKDFLKNTSIIFLSQQDKKVIERVNNYNFYFSQSMLLSNDIDYSFSLPNVGTFGFALALFLGSEELYIAGSDSSFDPESKKVFADDTLDSNHESFFGKEIEGQNIISSEDIIEVKGNFKETIKSTRKLITYRNDYESFILSCGAEYIAYNLSEGAYIQGLQPLSIDDIDTSGFKTKEKNTNDLINKSSTIVKDLDFEKDIKTLNHMIRKVEKFKKLKITSKNDFLQKKLDIMIWILDQKKEMDYIIFGNIFLQFTNLIDIYINFSLNIKQNDLHKKEFLVQIKNYWAEALIALLKDLKRSTKEEI